MPSDPLRRSAALLLLAALICTTGTAVAFSSPHDALPMTAVLATLGGLLGGLALLRPRLGAEGARKALHVSMGVALAGLPWLFDRSAPVLALAGVATLLLAAVRLVPLLRRNVGGVLHDVARGSWGDLVYPLGVVLAFALSGGDRLAYVAAIGALALADPAAAAVGMHRAGHRQPGGRRWRVPGGRRSAAGTLACAAVAGAVAALAALFLGHSLPDVLAFALPVAVAAAAAEAATGGGLDNLTVPVATVLVAAASPALAWTGAALLAVVALAAALLGERPFRNHRAARLRASRLHSVPSPIHHTAEGSSLRSGVSPRVRPALS